MLIKILLWVMEILATLATISVPATVETISTEIDGYLQQYYIVTLDMSSDEVELDNGFSFDMFYGFQTTSEIAKRNHAEIAVNGAFYNAYGMPYGIMADNGKFQGINSNGSPTVIIDEDNQVAIADISIKATISSFSQQITLWGINISAPTYSIVLYDQTYGKTNRVYRDSITYVVKAGQVIDIIEGDQAVATNLGDYLITHITPSSDKYFEIGDDVDVDYDVTGYDGVIKEAFQTGGWLVKEGINVARDEELYVGPTQSLQPRTLVGRTTKNQLILIVIDGRDPEYSYGVTGRQAADILINAGCVEGGYLDGGASTTLVVGGYVKNKPSTGTEREIAHTLLIQLD